MLALERGLPFALAKKAQSVKDNVGFAGVLSAADLLDDRSVGSVGMVMETSSHKGSHRS